MYSISRAFTCSNYEKHQIHYKSLKYIDPSIFRRSLSVNVSLTPDQIQTLKRQGEDFKAWVQTDKGKKDVQEHREHEHYFKEKLSPENLKKLTDNEFAELWKTSWTSQFWSNKDWYVKNKLIDLNGIRKIREGLDVLLYGSAEFVSRYDNFRESVAGFGVAILSEFLNMIIPDKFCLWNLKPKIVLPFLGLDRLPKHLFKYNSATGEQYLQCVNYLTLIKNELSEFGIRDFIDLDIFFWHIFDDVMPESHKKLVQTKQEFEKHNITNLEDLIIGYDKDRDFFGSHISEEEAMKLRDRFVADFPPAKTLEMNIDDYVFGKIDPNTGQNDQDTFCYRLEFGIKGFGGIRGTPAIKFGIYCDKRTQEYVYNKDKYDSPESAFKSIKTQIQSILDAGKQVTSDKNWRNFAQLLEGDFDIMRHVRSKILAIYYPSNFLQMHSNKDYERILKSLFGLQEKEIDKGLFSKEVKLLQLKDSHPTMKRWSNFDYSFFLWQAGEGQGGTEGTLTPPLRNTESNQKELKTFQTLNNVAKQTYLSVETLTEIDELLNEKRQIIFYGPPGTGKTYVARKFSEYFAQGSENVEIVQFHQSYSYEDFVEGIKPKLSEKDEATGFFKQSGIFKNLVKRCIEYPNVKFVLIIDEINRGNISKIFGELIYLLEYRNENISLTYSPKEKFYIPSNLYIIGTMNSADRSIAFVDYALRRRFYFKDFYPDANNGILFRWFKDNNVKVDAKLIIDMLNEINQKITEQLGKEYQIGYSYFMVKDLNYDKLKRIIEYAIIPLIEQFFFGRKQKAEELSQLCLKVLNPILSGSEQFASNA